MSEEDVIRLDLTGCKTWLELHQRIKTTFDFPDCYGQNWDALIDFMSTEVAAHHVVILGTHTVPPVLEQTVSAMLETFEIVQADKLKTLDEVFTYEVLS